MTTLETHWPNKNETTHRTLRLSLRRIVDVVDVSVGGAVIISRRIGTRRGDAADELRGRGE